MKSRYLLLLGILTLTGCSAFEEAYYVDREFGKASQAAWDQQIVNKGQPYGDQTPEGMAGVTAEEVINVHTKTFAEPPTQAKIEIDID